jgi:hypothetical protein
VAGDHSDVRARPDGKDVRRRDVRRPRQDEWCYEANGPRVGVRATLADQFSGPDAVRVTTPTLLCNPAEKVREGQVFPIEDEDLHLACYEIHGKAENRAVHHRCGESVRDGHVPDRGLGDLCAPAEKTLASP